MINLACPGVDVDGIAVGAHDDRDPPCEVGFGVRNRRQCADGANQ